MNRIFLKVDGKKHCPNGICRPKFAFEWESGEVLIPAAGPVYISMKGVRGVVHEDDELWIWTHEDYRYGGGRGLTAKAMVGGQRKYGDFLAITLKHVELLQRPFGFKDLGKSPFDSQLLNYIEVRRGNRAYLFDETEYVDFFKVVKQFGSNHHNNALYFGETELGREIQAHKGEIVKALADRRLNWRKSRPAQAQFRLSLLDQYAGRCVLTGCSVPEALEAAHVLPHNGEPVRDQVENGLLLRRDLHSMFDAMLWSIDPSTHKVHLSQSVSDQPYAQLNGSTINHKVAPEPLFVHFIEFQKENSDV